MNGWYPFMTINEHNEYEGFDVDVVKELEKIIKKQIIIKDLGSLDSLFIALEQGSIDMIFSGLDITDIRDKKYSMIYYTGKPTTTISLVYKHNPTKALPDSICVEGGCSADTIPEILGIKNIVLSSSLSDMLLQLQYEKVEALLLENHVAQTLQSTNNDLIIVEIERPTGYCIKGMGIVIRKNNTELTKTIKMTIKQLRENGTMKILENEWNIES
jgi:ABC-type amino acid transport substrate-binding protein